MKLPTQKSNPILFYSLLSLSALSFPMNYFVMLHNVKHVVTGGRACYLDIGSAAFLMCYTIKMPDYTKSYSFTLSS